MSGLVQKIDEAIADHRAGRIAEAERKYREILAAEPTERKALQFLALIALQRRQPQLALDLMRNAIARDGRVAEFHNRLGEAHLALGQVGEAVQCFGKALRLRPYYTEARMNLEQATAFAPGRLHWVRYVMVEEVRKLIAAIAPERLDVLEVSGEGWKDAFKYKSYKSLSYPDYDVCAGPTPDRFDLIILDQVLEHVRHPSRALAHVRQSLRPGGRCLVSTPFLLRVHPSPLDLWRWTEEGLRCLLEDCGFDPAKIKSGGWGNRDCVIANFSRWEVYDPGQHSLENEPDYPATVWALAQL
ncbi:MAG TPA: tetratricopeptide repeat protein [Stellaceae bacterium]|nr:tetratricopeptide repeat protein [Stellaceae bacterium]